LWPSTPMYPLRILCQSSFSGAISFFDAAIAIAALLCE
jgi:hypothetical protein